MNTPHTQATLEIRPSLVDIKQSEDRVKSLIEQLSGVTRLLNLAVSEESDTAEQNILNGILALKTILDTAFHQDLEKAGFYLDQAQWILEMLLYKLNEAECSEYDKHIYLSVAGLETLVGAALQAQSEYEQLMLDVSRHSKACEADLGEAKEPA